MGMRMGRKTVMPVPVPVPLPVPPRHRCAPQVVVYRGPADKLY